MRTLSGGPEKSKVVSQSSATLAVDRWAVHGGASADRTKPRHSLLSIPVLLRRSLGFTHQPWHRLDISTCNVLCQQTAGTQCHFSSSAASHEQKQNTAPSAPGQAARTDSTAEPLSPPRGDPVYNVPNAISAARLVSGPIIGYWLLQDQLALATVALLISGASDWLDGYVARRSGQSSVFGSYLDPLADKALVVCVAGALLANGTMPPWLASVFVGREVLLIGGSFAARAHSFGWRWPGAAAFFRTADLGTGSGGGGAGPGGVAYMRPLLVSKANTVLQLLVLGSYLLRGLADWPPEALLHALEYAAAGTTVASAAAYVHRYRQGKLFT